ncbi:MAG: glycosyltransferase [Candidatus Krumholzibacteria bacterium]|nr:glycosyltransferase [Candidatus Krumholzibacteria bacterium]MDH4337748.1 glycosyltransferase [Candidatus Krumholzibacteria bacterium]MDH5271115.1 glycosyltransferase [Candidatus Krumholzibacteria bacterium]
MTSEPHRILILNNEFHMGGLEKKLVEFLARSDRSRFQYAVCCLKEGGHFKPEIEAMGIPFYEHLLRHRFDALAFRSLEEVLRLERSELIYTFTHPNTVLFAYLARMRGLVERVVVSYHATGNRRDGRQVPQYLLPLVRRFDALVAVAEAHKRYLVEEEGLPGGKIRVIYNGVDATRYRPALTGEREDVRAALGIPAGAFVMMAVASLKELKRLDLLLSSAAPRLRREPAAHLVLVGKGPERERLEALARELGVHERTHFLGVRDDVETVLRAADLVVLSSRTEAFPNVVLEAMATGLAVVTTDVGSVREMVEPEDSAIVVPPGDEAALARAIERLAGDATLRIRFGARGREIVEERFRIDAMRDARERLFEELLSPAYRGATTGAVSSR